MATYTPKELVFPLALTTSSTLVYTASGVTGIIKTFLFNVLVTPQRVTLLRNVAGTALVGEELVAPGYPHRFKGVVGDTPIRHPLCKCYLNYPQRP